MEARQSTVNDNKIYKHVKVFKWQLMINRMFIESILFQNSIIAMRESDDTTWKPPIALKDHVNTFNTIVIDAVMFKFIDTHECY